MKHAPKDASQVDHQVELLLRGCDSVFSPEELRQRIASGRPLRVKLGMDPTAPDLHLGHTVVLSKLRQFQDFGHKAVLIIGDYTARIGDPTGKSKTRPVLTDEEVDNNAQTYFAQAGKVLDMSPEKLEIRRNGEWLAPMTLADVIRLMGQMTVARMLERDTFAKRQQAGREIALHELLYPLMQARDSVEIHADVELGGTDQTFNNLCGRDFQRHAGQPPQVVMVLPILVGTDGKEKMSKSLGNYVAVTDSPGDMFGKIMRIPDEMMRSYFELVTELPGERIDRLCDPTKGNPRDSKETLAKTIIATYHSIEAADAAGGEFRRIHAGSGGGGLPDDIPEVSVPTDMIDDGRIAAIDLVTHCGFAKSRGEARRLIVERGVRINGQVLNDMNAIVNAKSGDVVQRGKRRFVRLIIA